MSHQFHRGGQHVSWSFGVMIEMVTPVAEPVSTVGDTLVAVSTGHNTLTYVCTSPLIAAGTFRKHRLITTAYGIRQTSCHLVAAVRLTS